MSIQAVWRIAVDTPSFKADDLSGEGAKKSGGRWNRKGTPVLYTSESIALACLETLVHINAQGLPLYRYLVRIDIPAKVWDVAKKLNVKTAGNGWDALPAGSISIEKAQRWLQSNASALMLVPSVVIPQASNVLINPRHPDVRLIKAKKIEKFSYDPRLVDLP
jgi:RES domain-containing protein